MVRFLAVALASVLGLAGCGAPSLLTPPLVLCAGSARPPACRDPREAERLLGDPALTIVDHEPAPAGIDQTRVLTVSTSADGRPVVFRAKFRAMTADVGSSSARKELAVHALQKLILEPEDWVVPPAALVCIPLDVFQARLDEEARATFRGTSCVAGILSWWIEGGRSLEDAHDAGILAEEYPLDAQLLRDSASYRTTLADLNVVSHVVTHGDSHWKQFVIIGERSEARILLVDNSMAFDGYRNRDLVDGPWDWSNLHVPAVRRATVERLGEVGDEGLETLATVAQRRLEGGQLVEAPIALPSTHTNFGVRWIGPELQVGLTRSELTRLKRRARQLVNKLEAGTLRVF